MVYGFIFLSATGGEADFVSWRCGCDLLTADPTGENEPTPDERLPPRETRTELRGTTARTPELHGQRNALEIERSNPTLQLLPTNADQHLPTPSGPTDLKKLSHTFLLRELLQVGRDAGSAGRVGEPTTPASPKESIN